MHCDSTNLGMNLIRRRGLQQPMRVHVTERMLEGVFLPCKYVGSLAGGGEGGVTRGTARSRSESVHSDPALGPFPILPSHSWSVRCFSRNRGQCVQMREGEMGRACSSHE
jgi:hypothetical protein